MSYTKHLNATLNLTALTDSGNLFQYSTTQDNKCFQLFQQLNATKHNKTVTFNRSFQGKHVTYCWLLGCWVMISSTKRQTKNMSLHSQHHPVSHDTQLDQWHSVRTRFSPKLGWLQKALLTKAWCHDRLLLLSCVITKSLPWYTSPISHWPLHYNDLLFHILIGPRNSWLIINSPLLIIIPNL